MSDAPAPQRKLDDSARLECKICWYVYNPAVGDPVHQVEPGTPFLELPDFWRCPECDAGPDAFVPVNE